MLSSFSDARQHRFGLQTFWLRLLFAWVVLAVVVFGSACSTTPDPTVESLGLPFGGEIQAGATFQMAVPTQKDTRIEVLANPTGISSATFDENGMTNIVIEADENVPRGDSSLSLRVFRDGNEFDLSWPFTVIARGESDSQAETGVDTMLVVESPEPGELFPGGHLISGLSSSEQVGWS